MAIGPLTRPVEATDALPCFGPIFFRYGKGFQILNENGETFFTKSTVLNEDGNSFAISSIVLNEDGTQFEVL